MKAISRAVGALVIIGAAASVAHAADPFAVGVLACAAESDRDRRLECYDEAVAGYTARLSEHSAPAAKSAPAVVPAQASTAASSPPAAASSKDASAERHVAAKVLKVDYFPDYVVIHLDNQQIWRQVAAESPAGFELHPGDAVSLDRQMGSYWLSGRKGGAIQVKLQTPK